MKYHALLFSVLLAFCSCSKEDATISKGVTELVKSLETQNKDCTCQQYLNQYTWRGKTVYAESCSGAGCNCFVTYYDSDGKPFEMPAGYTFDDFRNESQLSKNVWTCH